MHLNNENRNFLIMFYVVLLHVKTQEDLKKLINYLNNFNKEESPKINTLAYFQNLMNEEDRIDEWLLHQVIHYLNSLVQQSEPNEIQVANIYNISTSDKNQVINLSNNDIIDCIYSFLYTSHSQLINILFLNFNSSLICKTIYKSGITNFFTIRFKYF